MGTRVRVWGRTRLGDQQSLLCSLILAHPAWSQDLQVTPVCLSIFRNIGMVTRTRKWASEGPDPLQ